MTNHPRRKHSLSAQTAYVALTCLLLAPAVASAQQIGGTVSDTTGGVLPGVTVEVRSPALIEQVRTAITDGNGQYLVVALEIGTYSVTYSLPGFGTLVRDQIEMSSGFTANIDVQLSVGDIQETVTVSGATPVVDIQNVEQRAVMDRQVIDSIPTGKSFQSYALLVPGMGGYDSYLTSLSQDSGGMTGQTLGRLAIHGGDQEDQQLEINGMDVGDSLTQGANYSVFPDSNFEELAFNYSASPAEIESGGVRINMIPREGANQFSGHLFTTFTTPGLNADNVGQDLKDRGLSTGTFVDEVWTINPVVGGPLIEDRLWFFGGHTTQRADLLPADLYLEADSSNLFYVPGDAVSIDETLIREQNVNFTFQATSRDKIKAYWTNSATNKPRLLQGRTLASIFVAPASAINGIIRTNTYQATWTRPQTNRLLFEAGVSHLPVRYQLHSTENAYTTGPGTIEVPGPLATRNMSGWFQGATSRNSPKYTNMVRGSMSYVTGSHNLKFGVTSLWLAENAINSSNNDWTSTVVLNYAGLADYNPPLYPFHGPISATFRTGRQQIHRARSTGLYAQEQWTLDRLTVNAGIRYDFETSSYPEQILPQTTWQVEAQFLEGQTANGWHDLQPRLGLAYDLLGDGRTAVKFSAHRYGKRNSTDIANLLNPALNNSVQGRTWYDGLDPFGAGSPACIGTTACIAGDGLVQGTPLDPNPNGELLSSSTVPAFGLPIISTVFDQNWAFGWGNRPANWEISASIQQELMDGMSVDVAYFHRDWVSFRAFDDRVLGPDDFDRYQLAIPTDPRLPGGGGGTVSLMDIKPASVQIPSRIYTDADQFGGQTETWQGLDVTIDARLQNVLLQGGLSTGATSTDNCAQLAALPENQGEMAIDYCDANHNWVTQVKLLGSYTLPYDIQVAATLQNQPGPPRIAEVTYTRAQIAAALGRPSGGSGSIDVNVIPPGTVFGERFNQLDLRLTKIIPIGDTTRLRAMFDLFNLFNANAVTREQPGFGTTWLTPQVIMPGRLIKFAFQFDF